MAKEKVKLYRNTGTEQEPVWEEYYPRTVVDAVMASDADNENRTLPDLLSERADNISLTDGALQLLSGNKPIGSKIRLPEGGGGTGREIELRKSETAIQWRYTDSNEWTDLISIADITGPAGEAPTLERRGDHLWAIYKN